MYLMLAIGIPVFLVFGGALLALAFSPGSSQVHDAVALRVTPEQEPMFFFNPVGEKDERAPVSADELVSSIEFHLRRENQAAREFAHNPSHETLWEENRILH